jgi:ABC-type antimicrobial peptide transport system permease subunit
MSIMRFWYRTFRTSLYALRRNLLRSMLTALGIVIGIAAVIAMVEIGQGSARSVQQALASIGGNILLVMPGTSSTGGVRFGNGSMVNLTPADAAAIERECPAVSRVAPYVRARTQVVYGNRNWAPVYLYGTTPAFLEVRDWEDLEEGCAFTDQDVKESSQVCLLGQTVVHELFGNESPIGQYVRLQSVAFQVIGVLSRKGANMMGVDQDDILLAPWTTIKYRVTGTSAVETNQSAVTPIDAAQRVNSLSQVYPTTQTTQGLYPLPSSTQTADTPQPVRFINVDRILVRVEETDDIPEAMQEISGLLHERHHLHAGEPEDFTVRDATEMSRAMASTASLMTNLLLGVALISLAVGGVGIMNIMLVSVTERTREIGLRMAVGARSRDILKQFLVEASLLCLLGGITGVVVGRASSYLIRSLLGWPTAPSAAAMAAAVGVAVSVGVAFGFYPAWKASRLDPIEALRYE